MSDAPSSRIVDLAAYRAARSTDERAPRPLRMAPPRPQPRAIDHRARMLRHLETVAARGQAANPLG